jgi:ubiquinone/menaquinone biosynthesis C-methylase UbiE
MTDDVKSLSTGRFNRFAERYVQAAQLGQTDEPQKLVEMAQPKSSDRVLDIATGGGHTALAFAPYVREVVAHDLALGMLHAARSYLDSKEAPAWYVAADAESLPFPDASFDIVSCRIAQHHFPDVFKFVRECARVLRPGGRLVQQDQVAPEEERAARYLDSFERLRDPSHFRVQSESEWRSLYLDAGLTVDDVQLARHRTSLETWAARQDVTPQEMEHLHIMMAQAPDPVRAWVHPEAAGTPDAKFDHVYILICGSKPE